MSDSKYKGPKEVNPLVAKVVLIAASIFIAYRLAVYSMKVFYWMGIFIILSVVFFSLYKKLAKRIFKKCPSCDEPLENYYQETKFKGAKDIDTGEIYEAIALIRYECPKCDLSYLQLRMANTSYGVGKLNRSVYKMRPDLNESLVAKVKSEKKISKDEYQKIVNELTVMVNRNNNNAGFVKSSDDIDLTTTKQ